jgi:hypothetical protein
MPVGMDDLDIPSRLRQVLDWIPVDNPNSNLRRDTHRYFRPRWRGQWHNKLTYYYSHTQVLPKKAVKGGVDGRRNKPRVYVHLMRHGEVYLHLLTSDKYTDVIKGHSQRTSPIQLQIETTRRDV